MAINRVVLTQDDKYQTTVYTYNTDAEEVKGTVVVLHGMAEHHERYIPFANFLNGHGYDVFLYDHRGHGTDKKFEELGHFADKDGDKLVIADAINVLRYAKANNRGSKLILFGHSMGSIIARNVIQQYDEPDKAIICGTAYMAPFASFCGMQVANIVKLTRGARVQSPYLANLTTGYKDFAKISNRTAFDWLTRDNSIVGAYINDPYCGFVCSSAFYHDLIRLTYTAARRKLIKKTRRDLPILLISGALDPVGGYGAGVTKLFALLQKLGFNESDCTIYEECRHELLNELNSEAIMNDILNWIEK
ncbi:MAG: lysophospholipase [Lachnospiraceae bacterium]|nr:lysophospholipase [Lachnospiraceae bacterium]